MERGGGEEREGVGGGWEYIRIERERWGEEGR